MNSIDPSRDQTGPGRRELERDSQFTVTSLVPANGLLPGGCGPASEPRLAALPACVAFSDLLVDLSDGELPQDLQHEVHQHVAACPGCRAELSRLDASLARLAGGIATAPMVAASRRSRATNRRFVLAVAATSLICIFGYSWNVWHLTPNPVATLPAARPLPQALLSPAEALRQIALIEQHARLQTSLDLLPTDPAYADQRATNERLLVKFQEAAAVAAPRTDKGDTL